MTRLQKKKLMRAAWCCVDEHDVEAERYFRRKAAWKFEVMLLSFDGAGGVVRLELPRSEQPVTSITKSGQDVPMLVQFAIKRCAVDKNIRVCSSETPYSLWCRDETEKSDACCPGALE